MGHPTFVKKRNMLFVEDSLKCFYIYTFLTIEATNFKAQVCYYKTLDINNHSYIGKLKK